MSVLYTNPLLLVERHSEEYVQKLFGRSDLDDALKRLDQLTHRQARMAEILNATNTVDKGVKGVADDVLGVDGRATRVDKILATVDNRIAGVDNWEIAIGDRVKEVDDKGAIMIGRAQATFCQPPNCI